MSVLEQEAVLLLNKKHEAIRVTTPKKVFGDFATWLTDRRGEFILGKNGLKQRKMLAYDIDFMQNPDGSYDFNTVEKMELVDWDTWVTLPVRSYDLWVQTPRTKIRVPRVVLTLSYDDMPEKRFNLNFNTVYDIYNGTCAYTHKKLKRHEANLDHVIPRDKGGETTWSNIVLSDKDVNSAKGSHYNYEVGLPDVVPIVPENIPMIYFIKNKHDIPEWNLFLRKSKS